MNAEPLETGPSYRQQRTHLKRPQRRTRVVVALANACGFRQQFDATIDKMAQRIGHPLATDYDGTISTGGRVCRIAMPAIDRLRRSGRRAILVTGRCLDDLLRICPHQVREFDYVVAENGAVVYEPNTKEVTLLANPGRHSDC